MEKVEYGFNVWVWTKGQEFSFPNSANFPTNLGRAWLMPGDFYVYMEVVTEGEEGGIHDGWCPVPKNYDIAGV